VGKINTTDKIIFENQEKGENMEIIFLDKSPSKRSFTKKFTAC